jgi:hypothetical protein
MLSAAMAKYFVTETALQGFKSVECVITKHLTVTETRFRPSERLMETYIYLAALFTPAVFD